MRRLSLALGLVLAVATMTPALGSAFTFSIDFQGPTAGAPDAWGPFAITAGDILTPGAPGPPGPNPPLPGPLPAPGIEVAGPAGGPGVLPGGLGIVPGASGFYELDALSYGRDTTGELVFSVDDFATGVAGPTPPDVFSEGSAGAAEASADVFRYLGPVVPTPPGGPGNTAYTDGDGLIPSGLPGVGLIEPNPPTPGFVPDPGDNLDAVDVDTVFPDLTGPIFFSLDATFPDALEPFPPVNNGTAIANGFAAADVLVSAAGGAPALAIPAATLGLDLVSGMHTDDLDALIFDDADGTLTYTPGDTVYFSVRRGSAVIGGLDSMLGIPIEPGDVLTVPFVAGGLPAIFIAAESLGLTTARGGTAGPFGADELDALDLLPVPVYVPVGGIAITIATSGALLSLGFGALTWSRRRGRH